MVGHADGWVPAIEVKIAQDVGDEDLRHLACRGGTLGPHLLDALVVTTGREAYRRADGIGVVSAVLLGP